jgi:hypothetical protein
MIKFEVRMNSNILKSMLNFNVQVPLHETMRDVYPFVNNVCYTVIEIIWNFYDKFKDENYVTTSACTTFRPYYDISSKFFGILLDVHCRCFRPATYYGDEDHVWFEDRWMVASLCDEWLTTLCGLILG